MKTTKEPRRMLFTSNVSPVNPTPFGDVRQHLAEAMVGKTVDLRQGRSIAHGIVSGVLSLAGHPKLLVNGRMYDLNQVLTASPA